jgi:hypothetical protein
VDNDRHELLARLRRIENKLDELKLIIAPQQSASADDADATVEKEPISLSDLRGSNGRRLFPQSPVRGEIGA